ncbi:hypothetical protein ACWGLF_28550 [Streptomyces puniciscabiei]
MVSGTGIHCTYDDKPSGKPIVQITPGTFGQTVDPRTRYGDATLRPGFIVCDADAGTGVGGGDTQVYDAGHHWTLVTGAHEGAPAFSPAVPSLADARARVAELAVGGPSYIPIDVITAPVNGVLGEVIGRG